MKLNKAPKKLMIITTDLSVREKEFKKDKWQLNVIGCNKLPYDSCNTLGFRTISQEWLKVLAKRFIGFHLSSKANNTLRQYMRSIKHFSDFIEAKYPVIHPEEINREIMVNFIEYVHQLKQVPVSKNKIITHIRMLITTSAQVGWETFTKENLLYQQDRLPVVRNPIPRYIPMNITNQLEQHLDKLEQIPKTIVFLLLNTGRRIGEICALKRSCLVLDHDGDYILRYYEFKMKKEETIPINHATYITIRDHILWLNNNKPRDSDYLFPDKRSLPINPSHTRIALNKLAQEKNIKDTNGDVWHFQPHQFRHTVGTRMVNAGMPIHIIQRYLGHVTSEMTMNYAHIHDNTMKKEYLTYQDKLVNNQGDIIKSPNTKDLPEELKWLKANILAQALPNGYCSLPIQQGGCPHANACLSCGHFRTSEYFLDKHLSQLDEFNKVIAIAKEHGWRRQVEMNEKLKTNLTKIINSLE